MGADDVNESADALLALQDADLELIRAKKKLDTLPQKEQIVTLRTKRKEVLKKRAQVVDMADDIDQSLNHFQTEDAQLVEKISGLQKDLDEGGDYRHTEHITKEMDGLSKRREKIDFEVGGLTERMSKIDDVAKQMEEALAKLDAKEDELTRSYQNEGHNLQEQIAELEAGRKRAGEKVDPELLANYERLAASKGGVGAARLVGKTCSVCRVEYQEGQLMKLKSGPVISVCPNCKRILIVKPE